MGNIEAPPTRKEFKNVEFRLHEWGLWVVASIEHGLGYPSQSTIVSALSGSRATGPKYLKDNINAEEVHIIVHELTLRHPEWVTVLKMEYTEPGVQVIKAKRLKIARFKYRNFLDKAKAWIEARLS